MPKKKTEGSEEKTEKKKVAKKAEDKEEKVEKPKKKKATLKKGISKELEEKAKKFAEKIGEKEETGELKEKLRERVEEERKKKETLIPINDYVKSGIYIGTKVITPHMRPYVYRRRADGIAILNTSLIDEKLKEAAEYLAKYDVKDFIIVCKREAGWRAVRLFSELTGVKVFTKKYPAGVITNTDLPNFFETELIVICDPWLDKNALRDAQKVRSKVMALCDTNNLTFGVDFVLPCNNKGSKSLGVVFYILAREYVKAKKLDIKVPDVEEFIGGKLEDQPNRK
ncbi:MAG: 30S ribosomal protein S2 [archaeon]